MESQKFILYKNIKKKIHIFSFIINFFQVHDDHHHMLHKKKKEKKKKKKKKYLDVLILLPARIELEKKNFLFF